MHRYFESAFAAVMAVHLASWYTQEVLEIILGWSHHHMPYELFPTPSPIFLPQFRPLVLPFLMGVATVWAILAALPRNLQSRPSIYAARWLVLIGYVQVFLVSRVMYVNHHLLFIIVLLIFVMEPALSYGGVLLLLRAAIASVLFYAGIAKINTSWLIEGSTLRIWFFEGSSTYPYPWIMPLVTYIGPLSTDVVETAALALSWASMLLDLLSGPLFLWCVYGKAPQWLLRLLLVGQIVFHALNNAIFSIGAFPFFMLSTCLLWIPGDRSYKPLSSAQTLLVALLVVLMVTVPARPYLTSADPAWDDEGFIGAWRMMLHHQYELVRWVAPPSALGEGCAMAVDAPKPARMALPCDGSQWHLGVDGLRLSAFQRDQTRHSPVLIRDIGRDLMAPDAERVLGKEGRDLEVDAWRMLDDGPHMRWLSGPAANPTLHPRNPAFAGEELRASLNYVRRRFLKQGLDATFVCINGDDARGFSAIFYDGIDSHATVGTVMGHLRVDYPESDVEAKVEVDLPRGNITHVPLLSPHRIVPVDNEDSCFFYAWDASLGGDLGHALRMR